MKKLRVLMVEDSLVIRELLTHVIAADPRLNLVGAFPSAELALTQLHKLAPDVISIDIRLPGMNGLDATLKIMCERPTPIVVVADCVQEEGLNISLNALRAGALSVIEKPGATNGAEFTHWAALYCDQLVNMSAVKVLRQRGGRIPNFGSTDLATTLPLLWTPEQFTVIGIVASTGGPQALSELLGALPKDFPLPILLVQHITSGFTASFAAWLDKLIALRVKIATDGEGLEPSTIYMAPADHHITLVGTRILLSSDPLVSMQRPSGTVLFRSLAMGAGKGAIGVLLTGMGEDGAEGLLDIQKAGGYTIAEDESTAVVFGMPAAAINLGAVCETLPLTAIAQRLQVLLGLQEGAPP